MKRMNGIRGYLAGVNEGPADCIKFNEVAASLKKMKSHKGPGVSGTNKP